MCTRPMKIYLADVTEEQGELFAIAVLNGKNICDFAREYMKSWTRKCIDDSAPVWCNMMGIELYRDMGYNGNQYTGFTLEEEKARWLGEFYCMLQYVLNKPSAVIVDRYKPEDVIKSFEPLHDYEISLAVKKFLTQ